MADKKEVSILLLGIVAILAIVGLVLLFTSPAATGRAFTPPSLPPDVQAPAGVSSPVVAGGGQYGQISNVVLVSALEGSNLPACPNGDLRTREQGNIAYAAIPDHLCNWFYCPSTANSDDPAVKPMLACVKTG